MTSPQGKVPTREIVMNLRRDLVDAWREIHRLQVRVAVLEARNASAVVIDTQPAPAPTQEDRSMKPDTHYMLKYFAFAHLPEHLQLVSRPFYELAAALLEQLPWNSHSLQTALEKLLEAKDAAVRAAAIDAK